jgi:predicted O-methyltransferase YrrM
MKHTRSAIIHENQAVYLERIEPPRDPLLAEMEAYARGNDPQGRGHPISDPEVASFLAVTVLGTGAKRIVEVGTNIGYGAIVLGRAAGAGARVVTIEKSHELCEVARGFIRKANLSGSIEVREASALDALEELEGTWDLAYVDCVKEEYPKYLELLTPRMRVGGVVVADNVLWRGLVAAEEVPDNEKARVEALRAFNGAVVSPPWRGVILPLGDGVAYAVKGS